MVSETPPVKVVLDWDTCQLSSTSSSGHLTHNSNFSVRIGVHVLTGRGGAEWKWVDVEVGADSEIDHHAGRYSLATTLVRMLHLTGSGRHAINLLLT